MVVAEKLTPQKTHFDYYVPAGLSVTEGAVVFVPWRSRQSWGVVTRLRTISTHLGSPLKNIAGVLPLSPLSLADRQAIFFLARRYGVSSGFILRSFFPPPPRRGLTVSTRQLPRQNKLPVSHLPSTYWLRDNQSTAIFIAQYIKKARPPLALFFPLVREQEEVNEFLKTQKIKTLAWDGLSKISFWQLRERLLLGQELAILSLTRKSAFLVPAHYQVLLAHAERREFVQFDMNPRYALEEVLRARGLAPDRLVEAPRFDDWFQAEQKQTRLLQSGSPTPPEMVRLETNDFSFFSDMLQERMAETLQNNKKVILFHWQTGEAREISCRPCSWQAVCEDCKRPLILATEATLRCPACLREQAVPGSCPVCGAQDLRRRRLGLKGWRKQLAKKFPLIQSPLVEIHTIPELPITISDLGLVSILWADALWRHPNFDAPWRAWQDMVTVQRLANIAQVPLLIQTHEPGHVVLQALSQGKPEALYAQEKKERQEFHLPPFGTYLRLLPGPRSKEKKLSRDINNFIQSQAGRSYQESKGFLVFLPTVVESIMTELTALLPRDWHVDHYPLI